MSPEFKLFAKTLKRNGHFVTKPRKELFAALQHHTSLTIAELIERLQLQDQATVYRNIKVFEELGIIARLRLGWNSKLELSDQFHHHHHHLTCLSCGEVIVLPENAQLESLITQLAKQQAFKASDHQLEIRGYCKFCKAL